MKKLQNSSESDFQSLNLNPKRLPLELLVHWLALPRNPLMASPDPLAKLFIKAMLTGKPANFIYVGGSTPGASRTVHVSLVFQHVPGGRVYVSGFCPERAANRIFALDLMMIIGARN
jgi:predicted DNA-binding transcriptional regulator YafY